MNINPRAWAHTPRNTIARTDHLLDAWGDIFCRLKIHAILQITFERFIETPHHHLHRLRARSLNFLDDRRLNLWGDIFCKHDIGSRRGVTFDQFLATPNYYLCSPDRAGHFPIPKKPSFPFPAFAGTGLREPSKTPNPQGFSIGIQSNNLPA